MIDRALTMCLLLGLTGCGGAAAPAQRSVAACEARVDNDPVVKLDLEKAAGNLNWQFQYEPEYLATRNAAISRCMSGRSGAAPRGGVERAQ